MIKRKRIRRRSEKRKYWKWVYLFELLIIFSCCFMLSKPSKTQFSNVCIYQKCKNSQFRKKLEVWLNIIFWICSKKKRHWIKRYWIAKQAFFRRCLIYMVYKGVLSTYLIPPFFNEIIRSSFIDKLNITFGLNQYGSVLTECLRNKRNEFFLFKRNGMPLEKLPLFFYHIHL